jgi:hypothetical protein
MFYWNGGVPPFFACQRINLFVTDFFRLIGLGCAPYNNRSAERIFRRRNSKNTSSSDLPGVLRRAGEFCA